MPSAPIRYLYILLLLACCPNPSAAQHALPIPLTTNYQFTELSARHGLPSSEILSVYIDRQQQLWIGHVAGLSRYDGYQLSNYLFSGNRRIGRVFCFVEDTARKTLWIGAAGGLFFYHNKTLHHVNTRETNLPVYSLLQQGRQLWVGTGTGPALLDTVTLQQALAQDTIALTNRILPAWRTLNDDKRARKMCLLPNGQLLVGNPSRVYEVTPQGLQLIWQMSHPSDILNGISCTNKGEVFICGNFSGVNYREGNTWKQLKIPFITGMDFHQEGNHWYYYNSEAIFEVDVHDKTFRPLVSIPFDHREWGSAFACDKDGNFWIATHEGLLYAKPEIFKSHLQPQPEGFNELYSILQRKDGTILTGGNRGRVFRLTGEQFTPAFPNGFKVFPQSEVKSMLETPDGELWCGSGYQGLARLTKSGWRYYFQQGGDKTFLHLYQSPRDDLYTTGDKNLTRIRKLPNDSLQFSQYTYPEDINDNPQIKSLIESPGGAIYVGSSWGLARLQNDRLVLQSLKDSQHFGINDMQPDHQGNIWIATQGNGLLRGRFEKDSLVVNNQLTIQDGLSSDIILKLLVDKDNVLWALAYNGLNRIATLPEGHSIVAAPIDRQLLKGDYQNADMLQDKDNRIWMATSSGLLSFDPQVFAATMTKPLLYIESIQLLQDGKDDLLEPSNGQFPPGLFNYRQNTLEILYTGIHYSNPGSVQYEYRISGEDTGWIKLRQNRQVTLSNLSAGDYIIEARAAAGSNQYSNIVTWPFTIRAPFWRTTWFILLIAALAAGIAWWLVRQRLVNLRKKAATQRDFERQIARVKMNMLRAQMNPHFIFNSLNSINNFILRNDPQNASGYLTKFSRLMRMILDNSRSEWVTLENELDALDLYIQLESIRFDHVFEYQLTVEAAIDPSRVIIPPLIIQPYVENAIWHGLLYREQPGGLLTLEISRNDDQLIIRVEDNGVGRKAAAAMRSRSALKNKSHGMKITGERLDIVNMTYDANTSVEVIDLYNDDHQGIGTRVLITLNYIQNKMA
ncbi:sensor histidine kinase [Paraflavitalea pollutisoli]|uniref:sensor histidine kinase n=1 Tax=Paraflavitalea pollutisoli TaxID=3034143 RepID=UPI0023ECF799|nr:histidine kinase [Paraflavitalea sp. H1-2-19X]